MDEAGYNAWKIVSLSPLPGWAMGLLIAAAVGAVFLAQRGLRREQRVARRVVLLGLRAIAALTAIFLLLEPGVRHLQTSRAKNRLAVLVDRSGSMAFPASPGGPSRSELVAQFFQSSQADWKELAERFTVEVSGFDRESAPVELSRLSQPLETKGTRTDLLGAIRNAAEGGGSGRKLSGVLLVTDGADNVGLESGLTPEVRAELKGLGVPISSLVAGQTGLADVAVERVKVDDFAFVRNTVVVEAEIQAHGLGSLDLPVVLKREGRVVATKTVHLDRSQEKAPVTFSFAPDDTGEFVYTVSTPVVEGEAITSNNSRSFVLKVIRDRMRVLLVVGRPSWDERFLRGLLRNDPNVELVSFFILRTSLDDTRTNNHDEELSLIPFPVQEIFDEKLKTFDVVIFQNFAHRDKSYQMDQYLGGMRDYIANGGAFVMIGGENSFGDGKYDETALADALPVEGIGAAASPAPFRVKLTDEGMRHPVTQVVSGSEANAKLFADLPPMPGLNLTRAKPGAQVLLEDPSLQQDGHGMPVLTLGEFGRGRVMAVTTDGLWSWTLPAAATGTPTHAYDKVWNQALRWLVKDPDLTTLRIQADHPMVEPGESVGATITLRRSDYGPAEGAALSVELTQVDEGHTTRSSAVTGGDGTAHVDFGALPPGPYKLTAHAQLADAVPLDASDAVAVRAAGPELSDAAARPQLLHDIADATGGEVWELPRTSLPHLPLQEPEVVEVGARKDVPLWDRWWPLALLVGALGIEWALRRRWGHL